MNMEIVQAISVDDDLTQEFGEDKEDDQHASTSTAQTTDKLTCGRCNIQFINERVLRCHESYCASGAMYPNGTVTRPALSFKCHFCHQGFHFNTFRMRHQQTCPRVSELHKDTEPCHKCDICHVGFRSVYLLQEHKRIVHKQRKHLQRKCKRCNVTFKDVLVLNAHQLLHRCHHKPSAKVEPIVSHDKLRLRYHGRLDGDLQARTVNEHHDNKTG